MSLSNVRNVLQSDAWALLALRSAPVHRQTSENMDAWATASREGVRGKTTMDYMEVTSPLARLEGYDFEYTMRKSRVTVGRNSSEDGVDVKIGHSTFVSRIHLEIFCVDVNADRPKFYIKCHGKNGIFVNGIFQQKGAEATQLPHLYRNDVYIICKIECVISL